MPDLKTETKTRIEFWCIKIERSSQNASFKQTGRWTHGFLSTPREEFGLLTSSWGRVLGRSLALIPHVARVELTSMLSLARMLWLSIGPGPLQMIPPTSIPLWVGSPGHQLPPCVCRWVAARRVGRGGAPNTVECLPAWFVCWNRK